MDPTQDTCGPDIRSLQALLDGDVTDPVLLFGALPTGDTPATTEAIRELSEQALGSRPCLRCGLPVDYTEHGEPLHPVCATIAPTTDRDLDAYFARRREEFHRLATTPPAPHRLTVADAGQALMVLAAEVERLSARDPLNDADRLNDDAWPSSEATELACMLCEQRRQADERRRAA